MSNFNSMIRKVFCLACLPFALCTTPPAPFVKDALPSLFLPFESQDSLCHFEAFGQTKFTVNGQRFNAHIELTWKSDRDFKVEFYSPFGGLIGSMTPERSGCWNIVIGETQTKKCPNENVEMAPGQLKYPFTYDQFMKVMTCRLLDAAVLKKAPDSMSFDGKNGRCTWNNDKIRDNTFDVTAIISRKHSSVTDVVYRAKGTSIWEVGYSSFREGVPKEIRFSDPNNNYFYLAYERIILRKGAVQCRKER